MQRLYRNITRTCAFIVLKCNTKRNIVSGQKFRVGEIKCNKTIDVDKFYIHYPQRCVDRIIYNHSYIFGSVTINKKMS